MDMRTEAVRAMVVRLALEIDPQATIADWPEALAFQVDMARAVIRDTHEPQSVEATAAGLTFCCGKEERLTNEIAALRNVVQRAMIAGCKEAFDAWNYHFPDKPMEPYQRPNAGVTGAEPKAKRPR